MREGYVNLYGEPIATPEKRQKKPKPPVVRRPATAREREIVAAFEHVGFGMAPSIRRFARDIIAYFKSTEAPEITDKQGRYLTILAWRYRKQMPARLAAPKIAEYERRQQQQELDQTG